MRWKDALLYLAKKLKGELHPRISLVTLFEVEPALFNECPHVNSLENAEELAKYEDEFAQQHLDEDGFPKKWKEDAKRD